MIKACSIIFLGLIFLKTSEKWMLSHKIIYLFITFLLSLAMNFLSNDVFLYWLSLFLFHLATELLFFVKRNKKSDRFLTFLPQILDQLILFLKMGESLQSALNKISIHDEFFKEKDWKNLIQRLQFDSELKNLSATEQEFILLMQECLQKRHQNIERITSWRRHLATRTLFAQKSRQMTMQARIQFIVSTALFLPAFFVNIFYVETLNTSRLAIAFILYVFALLWIETIKRSFRWKI